MTPLVEGPIGIVVLDGIGVAPSGIGNAVTRARTPTLDLLTANCPYRTLLAHGTHVGLGSSDDMGNSEVGHNALGAGRIFDQGSKLVAKSIATGDVFNTPVWQDLVARTVGEARTFHFIGLLSDGNVHSHIDHLFALLNRAARDGVKKIRVHVLLDGRDVRPTSAMQYVDRLEAQLTALRDSGVDAQVASGGGRMTTTMDRYEADWAMVERGYRAHVFGEGRRFSSLESAINTMRAEQPGVSDQDLPTFVIGVDHPSGPIEDGDAVVLFNFRGDRAIEISKAFELEHFNGFERGPKRDVLFVGMMQYDGDLLLPSRFLVDPPHIDRPLSEQFAAAGVSQLAISETQKFGHVTYFWNGNRSSPVDSRNETWIEIASDRRPFEERPWMKAAEITDRVLEELHTGRHGHIRMNFANGDMVGHTGDLEAATIAVEAVDLSLSRLIKVFAQMRGALMITADHGNADEMFQVDKKTGEVLLDRSGNPSPKTSHTLNPVPLWLFAPSTSLKLVSTDDMPLANLSHVAATLLELHGIAPPNDYSPSLLRKS